MLRSREGRRSAPTLIAAALAVSACAGSNLFQVAVPVGEGGPSVEITEPAEGSTVAQGSSLSVSATAEAGAGLASATFFGVFKEGGLAFASETVTFQNVPAVELEATLAAPPGQGTGAAWVVVSVTDEVGETAADTVSIVVN